MKAIEGIGFADVQAVYSGPEGRLWELLMGEQIHIGGLASSLDLAERAGIRPESSGVDLCCCTGAGMRFLVRFRQVARMTGVDMTPHVIELGRRRCREEALDNRIEFVQAEVTDTSLPGQSFDFVWGEDAWCYVPDKSRLIAEAARLVRPGGTIAFTDWVEGPNPLTPAEAERLLKFMKFPSIEDTGGYSGLLEGSGCRVLCARDTGRFAAHVDLYLKMAGMQLSYDALKCVGFDAGAMEAISAEMTFLRDLANAGKIIQAIFIAERR